MEQQGVEVKNISVRRVDEDVWGLTVSLEIMSETELDAIAWLVSILGENS